MSKMKNILTVLFLSLVSVGFAQETALSYSKVKVFLNETQTLEELAAIHLAVDHGTYAKGRYFITDLSSYEIEQLAAAGFGYEILIPDVEAWYADPSRQVPDYRGPEDCPGNVEDTKYPTPENFELGNMAGFFTWQEMLSILDDMKEKFPDLISAKLPIEGALTYEGRPIHWVRISDHPETDENEPEILYTALHHAREPASLSQLIYYMWYLLENYDSDEQIRYLIDHTEMYFIPCVNPDGYVYNQTNNPDGGGLWRKNRVENGDGSHGVDINRNYGHEWGYDNEGSSENPLSETYRGTEAFSEPETRAVRDFCNARQFQIALNYHTHGDLLIHPWGFSDSYTPDQETFSNMAAVLVADNHFISGIGSETVGYVVNGDSDDWMYGEQITKPSIFSFTPEVGTSGGFWPTEDQIIPNCRNTMLMNLNAASLLHRFGLLTDNNPGIINNMESTFYYRLKRIGLEEGSLEVGLTPLSDNILEAGAPSSHWLEMNESVDGSIPFTLNPEIQNGEVIKFYLSLSNGDYVQGDTITKIFIDNPPVFSDNEASLDHWEIISGPWNQTDNMFYSPPSSITDSPGGVYANNISNHIHLQNPVLLNTGFEKAYLNFWAKWDIEPQYDYAQVSLSVNGAAYFPLCGKFSGTGTQFQDEGNPVYDGNQKDWVEEIIDITPFVNQDDHISIRFSMVSDGYLQEDGFYFDDVRIFLTANNTGVTKIPEPETKWSLSPNPSGDKVFLAISPVSDEAKLTEIVFFNVLGVKMTEILKEVSGPEKIEFDTSLWVPGIYFCKFRQEQKNSPLKRLLVIH